MAKEMLINTTEGQECRIAIVRDGLLEELYVERVSSASRVGNVYKGKVTNVEPAIQAAFVDFGLAKNGFLHISDVHPQYFPEGIRETQEAVGRKRAHHDRPPIQACLRRGQEVILQLTKEGIGTKGPTLTTYLSIPGRLLVMMPGMSRLGVSRKIEDDEARDKARDILNSLKLPKDVGFILRTAGMDSPKRELNRDLNYLTALWKSIKGRIKSSRCPSEIYQESDLVTRTIRDGYNAEIERIVCDSASVARRVEDFLELVMPRGKHKIDVYTGQEGLFHDYGLEAEIEKIDARRVELPSGGSLVIDQTEALVAIDVNSGRFRQHHDAEATARKINLEAAKEVARQLRLRDLGGVIVIDFIDLREEKNRRAVEKELREAMKIDRAKTKVLKMSNFGLMEMTRQRMRPSLKASMYRRCACCDGTGLIRSEESSALVVMRNLQRALSHPDVVKVEVAVCPPVALHLANTQRRQIVALERQAGKTVTIASDDELSSDRIRITCWNNRGSEIAWEKPQPSGGRKTLQTVPVSELPKEPAAPKPAEAAPAAAEEAPPAEPAETAATQAAPQPAGLAAGQPTTETPKPDGTRKRRRRGGRRHRKKTAAQQQAQQTGAAQPSAPPAQAVAAESPQAHPVPEAPAPAPQPEPEPPAPALEKPAQTPIEPAAAPAAAKPKRPRRRRRKPAGGKAKASGKVAPDEMTFGNDDEDWLSGEE
ncbi:MAG TPA: ribonuclease E [Phycisphaerales bacterium]|nr:ribonuclease E [Phycisphaerales bacterium]